MYLDQVGLKVGAKGDNVTLARPALGGLRPSIDQRLPFDDLGPKRVEGLSHNSAPEWRPE